MGSLLKLLRSVSQLLALIIVASSSICASAAEPIQVTLQPGYDSGTVVVELHNVSPQAVAILTWDTPFEETLSHSTFYIASADKRGLVGPPAPYVGRIVKRGAPGSEQFMLLQAGETKRKIIELSRYYAINETAIKHVTYQGSVSYITPTQLYSARSRNLKVNRDEALSIFLQSNTVDIELSPRITPRLQSPAYANCTAREQAEIFLAAQSAEEITDQALIDLNSITGNDRLNSPRYTTWFGEYSDSRYTRVVTNYQRIQQALKQETLSFNCGCNETGVFAYVFRNRPYGIFLCPAFRAANLTGADSKAGTIVHELSHFTVLAGTDDHVYSQQGAQNLASTDPARAIDNADNYEYFAENSPGIDIRPINSTPSSSQLILLNAGDFVSGTLIQGESRRYQIQGAERIELTSLTGDADLYVYRDSVLSEEICRSLNTSQVDVCQDFGGTTVYAEVRGYSPASFTLQASSGISYAPGDISGLSLNVPVSANVAKDQHIIYTVANAGVIELESNTGDADLTVYNSQNFTNESLVCGSFQASEQSTTERCAIPTGGGTFYVRVQGKVDSRFTIVARSSSTPTLLNLGELTPGVSTQQSIDARAIHNFSVRNALTIQVTTIEGDADLQVFSNSTYSVANRICVSDESTVNSTTDTCLFNDVGEYFISVVGYEDSTYSIIAYGEEPPEDDPTATAGGNTDSGSGGGSGSGKTHLLLLVCLLFVLLARGVHSGRQSC